MLMMNKCRHPLSEDNLAEIADGRPRMRVRVRARLHLLRCWECRERLRVYRQVVGEVRAAPPFHAAAPEELTSRAIERAWHVRGFLEAEREDAGKRGVIGTFAFWFGRGLRGIWRSTGLRVALAAIAELLIAFGGWLWWRTPPKLVLESTDGFVLVNGKRIEPGRRLPAEATVTCIDGAKFAMRGVTVYASAAWTQFELVRVRRVRQIQPAEGAQLAFVDRVKFERYTVAAAGHVFEPMGTRFGVSVALNGKPRLSVYDKSVAVASVAGKSEADEGSSPCPACSRVWWMP